MRTGQNLTEYARFSEEGAETNKEMFPRGILNFATLNLFLYVLYAYKEWYLFMKNGSIK